MEQTFEKIREEIRKTEQATIDNLQMMVDTTFVNGKLHEANATFTNIQTNAVIGNTSIYNGKFSLSNLEEDSPVELMFTEFKRYLASFV